VPPVFRDWTGYRTRVREKYDGYAPDPAEWENESLYRVEPRVVFAWRDMPTATCWRFP
jgi:hypothetical protein